MAYLKAKSNVHTSTYTFEVVGYAEPVVITFVNGVFHKADFPFKGSYTAIEWEILREIASKIKQPANDF